MSAAAAAPRARRASVPARAWEWLRRNAILIFAGLAVAYMLIPIAVVALFSFDSGNTQGELDFAWNSFTLDYWNDAFANEDVTSSMRTSLELAAVATIGATAIGTLMALALVRHQFRGRRASNLLIILPMATPEIVIGAALLSMFVLPPFNGIFDLGFQTLLIAHVMFSISFVVVVVRSRLIGFDRSLEEAAADLGATPLTVFRTVTLPLLAPAIIAGGLLAFALSLDDFVISNFNSGTTETFPLYIFGATQRGIPVQVNVLATMLFTATVFAIALVLWQQRRAERMASVRPEEV
ncbi:MAG: ABC transporter permease [Solirubrobacterales bacterium]